MIGSTRYRIGPLAAVIAAFVVMSDAPPVLAAKKAEPSFFNSREIRSASLKPFKKWKAALKRYSKERAQSRKGTCGAKTLNICTYNKWMKFLDGLKGKNPVAQIEAVNKQMNRAKYITDNTNWGKKDYWASPGEFMARFGDCEDYAIAKYLSLRILGFKEKLLRVVAVKDMNLNVGHAVLVVFLGGKSYLLDNQIKQVVETKRVRHYQPVFSINKNFWWRHRS